MTYAIQHRACLLIAMLVACLSVAACANTLHGAGRDIENAGEAVQDTAQ